MAGYEFDYIFDWTIIKFQQAQKNRPQPRVSVSIFSAYFYILLYFFILTLCIFTLMIDGYCLKVSTWAALNIFVALFAVNSILMILTRFTILCLTASPWREQSCSANGYEQPPRLDQHVVTNLRLWPLGK